MSNLRWSVSSSDANTVLLSGAITEDTDFKPLVTLQVPGKVVFDLAGVEQINSCGVREWIYFTRNLAEVDRGFELARCSPAVVRQLNTISNFRGNGSVRSVMLPYYCAGCRREEYTFLDLSGEGDREIAEEIPCPRCGKAMEFDDIPDTYLSFAG